MKKLNTLKAWKDFDNLDHVLAQDCTDPDCELHNIDVALREEVVGPTDVAFYIQGGWDAIALVREGLKAGYTIEQALDAAAAEHLDATLA